MRKETCEAHRRLMNIEGSIQSSEGLLLCQRTIDWMHRSPVSGRHPICPAGTLTGMVGAIADARLVIAVGIMQTAEAAWSIGSVEMTPAGWPTASKADRVESGGRVLRCLPSYSGLHGPMCCCQLLCLRQTNGSRAGLVPLAIPVQGNRPTSCCMLLSRTSLTASLLERENAGIAVPLQSNEGSGSKNEQRRDVRPDDGWVFLR